MIKVDFFYVFYGFLCGLVLIGLFHKKDKVIIQYPTPFNVGKITYKDRNNKCFKYKAFRTSCLKNNQIIVPST